MDRKARQAELVKVGQEEGAPADGDLATAVYNRLTDIQEGMIKDLQGMDDNFQDVAEKAGRLVALATEKIEPGADYHGQDYLSQIGFWRDIEDIEGSDLYEMDPKLRALEKKLDGAIRDLERGEG